MLENIRISLRGIWSHKMRSFLTMLGIIIGIAAIIAIVSTIMGTNEQIKNNLIGQGNNTVEATLMQDGWEADLSDSSALAGVPIFDQSIIEEILEIDGAEKASLYHTRDWVDSLFYLNTRLSGATVVGIDENYLDCAGLTVSRGRGFGTRDHVSNAKVALIDQTACDNAFGGEDPIGKSVEINGEPFAVVGIVTMRSTFEPTINSISDYELYTQDSGGKVYIPDQSWPIVFRFDEPVSVMVRAASTDDMAPVGRDLANLLNGKLSVKEGSKISYQSSNLAEDAAQLQQLASSTNAMLIGIASISLLVGGIGVMNIMLVSVTERTREIGLKKALGAPRRTIMMQFLTEAILLSLIGGIVGVLVGIVLSHVIAAVAGVPVMISGLAILVAVGFSMAVGIIFGLVPSLKASELNPIDALRYE